MLRVESLIGALEGEVNVLVGKFINQYIPAQPEHTPDIYQHDVKAFCVLAHATFEEFVEEISLVVASELKKGWLTLDMSVGTIAMLMFYEAKLIVPEDEVTPQSRFFDQIRECLNECIRLHSSAISKNHGFSLKYLRSVFTPIGLDIPSDIGKLESLNKLADARGSYAHSRSERANFGKWKKADRPMVPEDALQIVFDCLTLCREIARDALVVLPSKPQILSVVRLRAGWSKKRPTRNLKSREDTPQYAAMGVKKPFGRAT